MKFFELETEHETAPIFYIDMGSVLADFFSVAARATGINVIPALAPYQD